MLTQTQTTPDFKVRDLSLQLLVLSVRAQRDTSRLCIRHFSETETRENTPRGRDA